MKRLSCAAVIALGLTGCATMQADGPRDTERLLTSAGFERHVADTPGGLAIIAAWPRDTLFVRTRDGAPQYVYARPAGCECLYVGTAQQYDKFRELQGRGGSERSRQRSVSDFASPFGADTNFWW